MLVFCACRRLPTADSAKRARVAHISLAGAPQSSKEHLGHLLLNLLVFCVQASDGSHVAVHARCDAARKRGKRHSPAQKLVLEVAVQGLVLSADDLAAVFNPYEDTAAAKEDCWLHLNSTHVRLLPALLHSSSAAFR